MTDDKVPHSKQPAGGSDISRRSFVYGGAAVAGTAALFGRTPLGRTALRPPSRHQPPLPRHAPGRIPAGGFTLNQNSGEVHSTGSVTLNLPSASTKGSLLIVTVLSPAFGTAFVPPAGTGWQLGKAMMISSGGVGGRIEQWYWQNNPGGLYGAPPAQGAQFTGANNQPCSGGIAEFFTPPNTTRVILDTVGSNAGSGAGTQIPVTAAGGVFTGSLGVFSQAEFFVSGSDPSGSWTIPASYTSVAGLHNGLPNVWSHSCDGNLTFTGSLTGIPAVSGGFSDTTDTSNGWAAVLCCYRAVTVAPIGVVGGEPTNCLDLDPTGQQLIVGGDVEGCFRTANYGDNWQPADYGAILSTGIQTSFADVKWSLLEAGTIYACTGKTGSGFGAFIASTDGGCTWTQRDNNSAQLLFDGNGTPNPPRPSPEGQDTDRTVNRLIAQDTENGLLYVVTANQGVMLSRDKGVTWGAFAFDTKGQYPRCIAVNPKNPLEMWVGLWDYGGFGGVYYCPNVLNPDFVFTQLGGYTGTVADLKVINSGSSTYLYAAGGPGGIYRSVNAGNLTSLNGSGTTYGGSSMNAIDTNIGIDLNTDPPRSNWVSIDGYVGSSGNHQIIAGCSGGVKVSGDNNHTNIVQLTLAKGATPPSYTDLTGPATITIATLPPFNNAWWHDPPPPLGPPSWQFWLGGSDSVNPHILVDPNTINNAQGPTIYLSNSGGFFRTTNGGDNWNLAVTGMPVIAMNCFAIDPTDATGTHFVQCGNDYTSIDVTGDPTGNTASGIVATDPGGNLSGGHRESHAVAIDSSDGRVYVGLDYAYSQPNGGAVMWRVNDATDSSGDLSPWTDTGYAAALSPSNPNNAPAVIGLIAGTVSGQRWALAIAQGTGPYYWNGSGWTPGTELDSAPLPGSSDSPVAQMAPVVAGRTAGHLYCYDRVNGIYRSTDYGQTWTQIWNKTTADKRSGWLAVNPNANGEMWVGADSGLFKLTGVGSGVVGQPGGPQVTTIGAPFTAGAAGIAFSPSGAIYAIALPGTASGAPSATTLYYSTDDGQTWNDACNGDGSAGSYGQPAGQLGISSTGWLWATGGEHFGYWGKAT